MQSAGENVGTGTLRNDVAVGALSAGMADTAADRWDARPRGGGGEAPARRKRGLPKLMRIHETHARGPSKARGIMHNQRPPAVRDGRAPFVQLRRRRRDGQRDADCTGDTAQMRSRRKMREAGVARTATRDGGPKVALDERPTPSPTRAVSTPGAEMAAGSGGGGDGRHRPHGHKYRAGTIGVDAPRKREAPAEATGRCAMRPPRTLQSVPTPVRLVTGRARGERGATRDGGGGRRGWGRVVVGCVHGDRRSGGTCTRRDGTQRRGRHAKAGTAMMPTRYTAPKRTRTAGGGTMVACGAFRVCSGDGWAWYGDFDDKRYAADLKRMGPASDYDDSGRQTVGAADTSQRAGVCAMTGSSASLWCAITVDRARRDAGTPRYATKSARLLSLTF
ncbi:hypothetical protein B0H10DRAFT_2440371 [Mycena sp. CBHHK59/15]|nr:hypothetical protein B0H10DRAFT_2440371 [Mycena sp. CBHHK59/15]